MAEFYTLEEAARVLGMSPDELKSKAQEREVRGFLDGGSWQFRKADVEELARRHGLGSDAELRLSDLEVPAAGGAEFEDLDLSEFQLGVAKADLGAETMQFGATPAAEGGSEHDLMIDDLSVPPNPVTGSSSVIIGMSSLGKLPSDSDVRLVPDDIKGASDSDVRLAQPHGRAPSDSDVTLIKDDTSEHGVFAASSSGSSIGPAPLLGSSAEVPAAGADSDFELSPSNELVDALQPESGSDFELSALDASDEFEATPLKPSDSDVTAADPNLSGINLSRPSDSGINLLGAFGGGGAESIELAPLSDEAMPTKKAAPPASPAKPKPSLSATPPPAVGKGEKDIFDDTDFEVDAALDDESDDKTVQLNAGSDFDLEDRDRRGGRRHQRRHGHGPGQPRRRRRRGRRLRRRGLRRDRHRLGLGRLARQRRLDPGRRDLPRAGRRLGRPLGRAPGVRQRVRPALLVPGLRPRPEPLRLQRGGRRLRARQVDLRHGLRLIAAAPGRSGLPVRPGSAKTTSGTPRAHTTTRPRRADARRDGSRRARRDGGPGAPGGNRDA